MGRRDALRIAAVWLAWLGALLTALGIGLAAGAYTWEPGWLEHKGLWPLFAWDFNWYDVIGQAGYPGGHVDRQYAFFPLWPLLLHWAGSHWHIVVGGALAWTASLAAFFGLSNGLPRAPLRSALALACWPGSFALALAYPDGIALAAAAWAAAFALRGKPIAAGALGAVAALARPNGVLIAIPLAWLARGKGPRGWRGAALPVATAAGVEAYFWSRSDRATAFFDAQRLWGRDGPRGLSRPAEHLGEVLENHALALALLAVVAVVALYFAWRRFGVWPTVIGAYVCIVPLLLAATRTLQGFVEDAHAALVLPLLVVLWRLGPRYRPWAAFSTVVVALLLLSGTIQSFGRQSLFAFPIFWAIADGPRWLRWPPLAVLGFAGNIALVLLLTHFAP